MFRGERRIVVDSAEQLDGSRRLKPVPVLRRHFVMEHGFAVLKMKAANLERGNIRIYGIRAAHKPQQNIRCKHCR